MTIINFKCKKCETEFDCEIGKVTFPDNINEKLNFEKKIICPKCNIITVDEAELTEMGQTDATILHFNNDHKDETVKPIKSEDKLNISIPKHMYWSNELKNPEKCPKCNSRLQKDQNPFFAIVGKDPLIIGCDGFLCQNCPVIILDNNEIRNMIHTYTRKNRFDMHIDGIIDLEAIPENQKMRPIYEVDPIPLVRFENYSNPKEHEEFIKDKSVFKEKAIFKEKEINNSIQNPSFQHKKVGRNESCPCGSGKKYKKCCLKI